MLSVVDARGTGAGWNLTVSATNFSDGSGHTLAPGTITGASAVCKAGNSCTAATSSGITYPLTVNGTAAKLFNAALNTGLGKIDVTPTFAVSIPGNAYAGTYTSTVTLASVIGPLSTSSPPARPRGTAASGVPANGPVTDRAVRVFGRTIRDVTARFPTSFTSRSVPTAPIVRPEMRRRRGSSRSSIALAASPAHTGAGAMRSPAP